MKLVDPLTRSGPTSRGVEILLFALIAAALAWVFAPVLQHPSEFIYSPLSDILPAHHPYRVLQVHALRTWGRIALWDPTTFGGIPLAADPQSGIYYPLNWLHALDPNGQGEAMYGWYIVIHLLIGAAGMSWWLRGHGFSPAARLVGTLALVLCAKWFFHVIVKGHIVFLPILWLPWQLGLVERIVARASPRRIAGLAGAVALMITGTHPQLVLYSLLLLTGYGLFLLQSSPAAGRLHALLCLAAAGMATLGLSAVFLLPIVDGMDFFVRGGGFEPGEVMKRSLAFGDLRGFLLPIQLPAERSAKPFVGALVFVLALFAPLDGARRPAALFWVGAGALFVWYALGAEAGLYTLLFDHVPGFDLFRFPSRAILILGLPLGYCAAAGFTALCGTEPTRTGIAMALAAALLGAGLLVHERDASHGLAAAALCLPALCCLPWPARARGALAIAIAAAVLAQQSHFAASLVETRPIEWVLGENPVVEEIRADSEEYGHGRVLAFDARRRGDMSSLPVTYATRSGIEILRGFNPLIPRATALYLYTGAGGRKSASRHDTTIETFPIVSRPHLDLFNVRWVVTHQPLEVAGLALRHHYRGLRPFHFQSARHHTLVPHTYLYENEGVLPRAMLVRNARAVASVEAAIEEIRHFDARHEVLLEDARAVAHYPGEAEAVPIRHRGDEIELRVDAGEGGYLVLSEVWYPGWRAESNGEAIETLRANGIFRALHLRAYLAGRWISLLSLLGLLVCTRYG